MTIIPEQAPPYSSEHLEGDVKLLFNNVIDGDERADFTVLQEDMEADRVSILYDFKKDVKVTGIDFWTNFGEDQGIKSFKVAVWNPETESWETLQEDQADKVYTLNWETAEKDIIEKQGVELPGVRTSKIKIILKDVGYIWNKFSMREIQFRTEEIPEVLLDSIQVKAPHKIEYKQGEELNLEGMVITATYSDGSEKEIPVEQTVITGYNPETIGKQQITVSYQGKTASFMVRVDRNKAEINKELSEIKPEKETAVKTGDYLFLEMWLLLLCVSGGGVVLHFRRKNR